MEVRPPFPSAFRSFRPDGKRLRENRKPPRQKKIPLPASHPMVLAMNAMKNRKWLTIIKKYYLSLLSPIRQAAKRQQANTLPFFGRTGMNTVQYQTAMKEIIRQAYDVLAHGGVILYPTDTVWGLGCDATNSEAVRRIYEIKRRSDAKAMLVLTDAVGRVDYYFDRIPEIAWELWEVTDKPLTLILPRARHLAPELMAEDGSVGIRITGEEVSRNLCSAFKRPIVSTSANISGEPTARTFAEISDEIKQAVDYILPLRQNETSLPAPSGIIKLGDGGLVQVIR